MSYRRLATGLSMLALAAVPAAAAAKATTSHAKLFRNKANTVTCGIKLPLPSHTPTLVLCSAVGIPKAKTGVGDPFVQIGRTGKPKLILVSQDEYETNTATKLSSGATWSNLGVTCKVSGKKVTCTNTSGHGFTIGNLKYKSF